jgi:death-on-curing protein
MIKYLETEEVLLIYSRVIEEFGGESGIRDTVALESAINRPKFDYYTTIIEKSAAIMESLAMNHPFVDGNKRMAFFVTDIFLRINGFLIEVESQDAYHFIIENLTKGTFKFDEIKNWLESKVIKV